MGIKYRRKHRLFKAFLLLCCFAALILGGNYLLDRHVGVTAYDVSQSGLPTSFFGYRMMIISDYHNAWFYGQIAETAENQKPDIIIFTGDMTKLFNNASDNLQALLNAFPESIPVYAITGNHETLGSNEEAVVKMMEGYGVTVLRNEYVDISSPSGQSIRLIGIEDPHVEDNQLKDSIDLKQIRKYISSVQQDNIFSVVACHRANLFPYLSDITNGVMLSGHLHGGIVRLPLVGGLFSESDYDAGVFSEGLLTMVVSRGCDYNPMRLFNPPEAVIVTLRK